MPQAADILNVKNLYSELTTVTDWYRLGLYLDLKTHELDKIEQNYTNQRCDRRMLVMLALWLRITPTATWKDVVSALQQMGENRVAKNIRQKYIKGKTVSAQERSKAVVFARENRQAIMDKFADFQTKVCCKLFKNEVDMQEFRLFVTNQFPPGDCIPPPPASLSDIFQAITHHGLWDYFHYSPIVRIAKRFGANDPEIEGWVQTYKKDLKAYSLVTTLEDYIEADPLPSRADGAKYPHYCPVEWKTEFIDHTLQYFAEVWGLFSSHYLEPDSPPTALLNHVRQGCLSVTWLVPSHLIPLFCKRAKIDTTFFQQYDIVKVTVGDKCIYEKATIVNKTNVPVGPEEEPSESSQQRGTFGGYDCNFVEPLPSTFKTECPICSLVLREPYKAKCCRTDFCHSCIQRAQADYKSCPTCREDNFEIFPDKDLKHSLSQLYVFCTYNIAGCEWTGKLGELEHHMNEVIHSDSPLLRIEKLRAVPLSGMSVEPEVMSGKENFNLVAYEVFHKHSADLLMAIQDPEVLASELFAEGVVSSAIVEFTNNMVHERGKRTLELLMAVESQLLVDSGAFNVFLSILAEKPLMSDLYQKMKGAYAAGQQSTIGYNLGEQFTAVDTYASYLKSVYTQDKLPVYDKWPHMKSKKYINLALIEKEDIRKQEAHQFTRDTIYGNIDDIKKSRQSLNINQIAQLPDGSQPKCILVEGAPGVGKSTFAWKLCRKWGKGKLLQQYQLVVLLRLRDRSVQAAKNISDLFQYHDHQIQQATVEEIQRRSGKGVFFLFEGYDELSEKLRSENSIFLDVITGRELPEATVLITIRLGASEFLHRECKRRTSQHIEILGFTKDNIKSYIEVTLPDDPLLLADLKKYIFCYPQINSLMYIPLHSAIVVEVYQNTKNDKTLVPKTMTELYFTLVRSLLLRYLLDHPEHSKKRWRVRSFSDLPRDVYQQLCELGRIAYEGILHRQQVIFSDLPDDFETLGLMQCAPELYADEGAAVSYNFLHLTVQEYLAAFHLSQQPVEKQIKHFREYKEVKWYNQHHHHFHMVLRFLCGVRMFNGYPSGALRAMCVKKYHDVSASVVCNVTFDSLHWLFEAQNKDVISKLLGSSDIQFTELSEVTLFDCFVLGYCVSHSNCTWKISILGGHIGDEGVELLVQAAVKEANCMYGISEIDFSRNDLTSEGVKHLFGFPKQSINKLKTLNLRGNMLDSESCAILADLIPHVPHLKKLNLSFNTNIGQGGAVSLITSLTAHKSFEELFLNNTEIGTKDCLALSELLSLSTSLKKLIIGYNALPLEAIELIISGLSNNTTLEVLDVRGSRFAHQNVISLASVLKTNHTLVYLDLVQCNIDSDGACQLASALCTNDTLQTLDLGYNLIGVKGAVTFAGMLLENDSLKELNLLDDSIGEEGTQKLIDSLTHNTTVKKLYLPEKYELPITDSSRVSFRVTVYN